MLTQKLAKLERTVRAIGAGKQCSMCFGRDGVGGTPLISFSGKCADDRIYDENHRCRACGGEPVSTLDITFPDLPQGTADACATAA